MKRLATTINIIFYALIVTIIAGVFVMQILAVYWMAAEPNKELWFGGILDWSMDYLVYIIVIVIIAKEIISYYAKRRSTPE